MHNAPEQGAKKPMMPIYRIVLIVFVIVAAIVIIWELRVRSQWNSTYSAIASQIDDEQKPLSKKDLDKLIQGNPRREQPEGAKNQELFIWSGILQKYRMRLHYSGEMVTRIESQ
ncbi:MAG: hypothetical protein NZ602_09015 [Thermoguttaceae bacterium]|nr:hypothetical protein [Thermoguttaceae bacterium]MDW8037610.1 hypothetical protein [Thermoguttaceae bacterium]